MKETIIETEVTYTLEFGGEFYIIKHGPVRVCRETGERFFSPETVERIQALITGWDLKDPQYGLWSQTFKIHLERHAHKRQIKEDLSFSHKGYALLKHPACCAYFE